MYLVSDPVSDIHHHPHWRVFKALGPANAFDRILDSALIVFQNGTAPIEDLTSKPIASFDTVYCMNI